MLSNVNALLIAWAISLIVVVGGVLTLEAVHDPNAPTEQTAETPAAEAEKAADEPAGETPSNAGQKAPAEAATAPDDVSGMPAPGQQQTGSQLDIDAQRIIPAVALPELLEQSPQGPLPKISEDGRKPFEVYAAPRPTTPAAARIALMVTDLGLRRPNTKRALAELPTNVAFAFSPYTSELNSWGEQSRRAGHEVFLTLPMEPVNYPQNDPGPFTLLTSYSTRENINILKTSLGKLTGYVGVVNYMGSRFTAASDSIRPVLEELNRRGLMFVDSRTTRYSRAAAMAKAIGLPVAINNGYIDEDLSRTKISDQLEKLEQRAKVQGTAMGLARPYPVTIEVIKVWTATLEERGFALVPVTSIANMQPIPR